MGLNNISAWGLYWTHWETWRRKLNKKNLQEYAGVINLQLFSAVWLCEGKFAPMELRGGTTSRNTLPVPSCIFVFSNHRRLSSRPQFNGCRLGIVCFPLEGMRCLLRTSVYTMHVFCVEKGTRPWSSKFSFRPFSGALHFFVSVPISIFYRTTTADTTTMTATVATTTTKGNENNDTSDSNVNNDSTRHTQQWQRRRRWRRGRGPQQPQPQPQPQPQQQEQEQEQEQEHQQHQHQQHQHHHHHHQQQQQQQGRRWRRPCQWQEQGQGAVCVALVFGQVAPPKWLCNLRAVPLRTRGNHIGSLSPCNKKTATTMVSKTGYAPISVGYRKENVDTPLNWPLPCRGPGLWHCKA